MLRVRNFSKFQHYKHRSPPWIKLHRGVLNDYDFTCLHDASKAHAMLLWLLASTCDNAIPDDAEWIARQLHASEPVDIEALVSAGILERYEDGKRKQRASTTLDTRKQNGGTEREGEKSSIAISPKDGEMRSGGGWPAAVADAWTRAIGVITPGRVGKDLQPFIRLYPTADDAQLAVVRAVGEYAAHCRRSDVPPRWAHFVAEIRRHVPHNLLPPERAA